MTEERMILKVLLSELVEEEWITSEIAEQAFEEYFKMSEGIPGGIIIAA